MRSTLCLMLAVGTLVAGVSAESAPGLDGASGHIYKVDLEKRCFELLKETEYDPKTDLGQSRFTVYWDAQTQVRSTKELKSFEGIDGPVQAIFQGLNVANRKALADGKPFEARVVTLYRHSGFNAPTQSDSNQVQGLFAPSGGADTRSGTIVIDGKPRQVKLRPKNWRIWVEDAIDPAALVAGFWQTTIRGKQAGERFVIREMEVSKLPDPRESDDPKLPRVLVIGDSISMNYHDAAKQALAGVANYHRCEGNAFTSGHGVRNAELWMGNFNEPGFHWDVIQFNHGLHDLKQGYDQASGEFGPYSVLLTDYKANLEKLIGVLKQSGAKLIWCSTTPVPNDNKGTYARRKGAAAEFNAAALEVMRRHPEILVNDLHGLIAGSPLFNDWRKGNDVHFYQESEKMVVGKAVAAKIREALAK